MKVRDSDFRVCSCINRDHEHKPGECDEPPTIRGGICYTCRVSRERRTPEMKV